MNNRKQTHSYLLHLEGARKHILRAILQFSGDWGQKTLVLFTYSFLISSQNSPHRILFLFYHLPTRVQLFSALCRSL